MSGKRRGSCNRHLKQNGLNVMHQALWERYLDQEGNPKRRVKGNKEDPCLHPRGFSPGGLRSATQLCLEAGGVLRTGLETSGSAPPAWGRPRLPFLGRAGALVAGHGSETLSGPREGAGQTRGEDRGGLTSRVPLLSPPWRPRLLGWVGRPQATDGSRCRGWDQGEQQRQVVVFRPRRQVPPVLFS